MSVQDAAPPSPDLKNCDRQILAISKYLRHNDIIKQRPALMGGQRWDMFKAKRAVRALLDPGYEKARKANPMLPEIKDRMTALQTLAKLPAQRFAFNVVKLETEDALAKGLKPQSGVPVVLISPQQRIGDNEYLIWTYNPVPLKTWLYAVGLVAAGAAIALYQLWPTWARLGSYYISMGCMVLVGVLIGLSIVRLVLFLLTVVALPKGFWLFPNLYADVSFFQSFRPLWSWSGEKTLPPKPKVKKRKSKAAPKTAQEQAANPGAVPLPAGVVPAGPDRPGQFVMHPVIKALMDTALKRAEVRLEGIMKSEGPKSEDQIKELKQTLLKEELEKAQEEFKKSQLAMAGQPPASQ